jgi:hypothetical protein
MAGSFGGDLYDFQNLTDSELRTVIIEQLQARSNLDADDIEVIVRHGCVTLEGRVGTDDEVQVAGEVLDDLLGLEDFSNNLVVDPLRRGENPDPAEVPAYEPVIGVDPGGLAVDETMIAAEDAAATIITADDLAAEERAILADSAISAMNEPLIAPDDTAVVEGEIAAVSTATEDSSGDLTLLELQQSDTAEHLVSDLDDEAGGTHDPIRAIRDGEPYSPPEGPVGDGYGSRENH